LEEQKVDGSIILKKYIEKRNDICDCGNEPSGSIKCGEFFD